MTSRLGWNSPSTSAAGAGMPPPVVTAGRTLRPRPRSMTGRSVSSPARLVCVTWYWRPADAQRSVSSRRWMRRCTLKCQVLRPGLKLRVRNGIQISALQPSSRRSVAASQMPSHSGVVGLAAGIDDAVVARAAGIDGEHVAGAAVHERAEHEPDVVLLRQRRVAPHAEAHDVHAWGLLAVDADDERLWRRPARARWCAPRPARLPADRPA